MAWRRSMVYGVVDDEDNLTFYCSPRPEVDGAWHARQAMVSLIPLTPALPAPWAAEARDHLQRQADARQRALVSGGGSAPAGKGRDGRPVPAEQAASQRARPYVPAKPLTHGRLRRLWDAVVHWFRPSFSPNVYNDVIWMALRTRRHLAALGYRWDGHVLEAVPLANEGGGPRSVSALGEMFAEAPWRWPSEGDMGAVAHLVAGRLLTELEILRMAERSGLDPDSAVEDVLAALTVRGEVVRGAGLVRTAFGGWRCQRCGETEQITVSDCAACGERECAECDGCRSMGPIRSCTLLYAGKAADGPGKATGAGSGGAGPSIVFKSHPLTEAQARAAAELEQFVLGDVPREALVWAVTGAGKTEMSYRAIARVLERGGRVLLAIPRRDIVRELGQRLAGAFPDVAVEVLHGGKGRRAGRGLAPGTLTVATTHQVLRFAAAFDLVIVDEVDAFPYRRNPMLQRAVVRALRPGGHLVHMSATPERSMLARVKKGCVRLISVPVRHHGHPLPVPKLHRDGSLARLRGSLRGDGGALRDAGGRWAVAGGGVDGESGAGGTPRLGFVRTRISRLVRRLIAESLGGAPRARVIVFVPEVALAEQVGRLLVQAFDGRVAVSWSHSRDPHRDAKLDALRAGRSDVFVATTILERGVTVADVDVIVLFADDERVFDEATLVQMAGRVGRSTARPTGRVHFVGGTMSGEMRRAAAHIQRQNEEAARRGLLVGTGSAAGQPEAAAMTEIGRPGMAAGAREVGRDPAVEAPAAASRGGAGT